MDLRTFLPDIEAAAERGWAALETLTVDGWLWRHSSGGSVRANTVATLAYSGGDPTHSINAIEAHCRGRRVPAGFTISDVTIPNDLDALLAARGYVRGDDHLTMAKWVSADMPTLNGITRSAAPSPDWMAIYLSGLSENRRQAAPHILEKLPTAALYITAAVGGHAISSGLTISDGIFASVQCMATHPNARRQGGAQRVLGAIEALAAQDGRQILYLQTSGDNLAAQALYTRAGFAVIGRYHTRTRLSP